MIIVYILWSVGMFVFGVVCANWQIRKDIDKLVKRSYDAEVRKQTMKYLSQFELIMVKKDEPP